MLVSVKKHFSKNLKTQNVEKTIKRLKTRIKFYALSASSPSFISPFNFSFIFHSLNSFSPEFLWHRQRTSLAAAFNCGLAPNRYYATSMNKLFARTHNQPLSSLSISFSDSFRRSHSWRIWQRSKDEKESAVRKPKLRWQRFKFGLDISASALSAHDYKIDVPL